MIEFVDKLEPENIAARLIALGDHCDAVAVIAADHPLVGQAIQALRAKGSLSSPTSPINPLLIARDTSALTTGNLAEPPPGSLQIPPTAPGRVAVFIGNHRYQCQDISDASFRSYIRENAGRLTVEDSRPTHEDPQEAYRIVPGLLTELDDLVGIYIIGGGISGVLQALREAPEEKRHTVSLICRDIGPETTEGLGRRTDYGRIMSSRWNRPRVSLSRPCSTLSGRRLTV